jgi:hypothetical protein
MKYITVLDFEAGRVFQYDTQTSDYIRYKEAEEFLTNKGHNMANCEWMVHGDRRVIVQTPHGEIKQLQRNYDTYGDDV